MLRMDIFALQNMKIGLWQAVKILKGYWSFTIWAQREGVFHLCVLQIDRRREGLC